MINTYFIEAFFFVIVNIEILFVFASQRFIKRIIRFQNRVYMTTFIKNNAGLLMMYEYKLYVCLEQNIVRLKVVL